MALVRRFFFGFQTGGAEEFHAVQASGSVVTSPTWSDKEANYHYQIAWKHVLTAPVTYNMLGAWHTVGCNVRFNDANRAEDTDFYRGYDATSESHIRLRIKANTDGDLQVVDANNVVQATIADVFANDTWYRVTVKFSGQYVRVWVVPSSQTSNEAPIYSSDSRDLYTGVDSIRHEWHNSGWATGAPAGFVFIGSTYCFTDTEASIDTERILGAFVTLLFNDTDQDGTAQFGDNLDSGRWDNTADVPVVDTDIGGYNLNLRGTSDGGVSADDGTNNGPKGQDDVNGRLLQELGIWRAKKVDSGKGNNWNCEFWGKVHAHPSPTADGTVATNFGNLSTSFTVFTHYIQITGSTVKDMYGQLGFKVVRSCPFGEDACAGVRTLAHVYGMWLEMLHEEPRLLIVDGKSQLIGA